MEESGTQPVGYGRGDNKLNKLTDEALGGLIGGSVGGFAILLVLLLVIVYVIRWTRKKHRSVSPTNSSNTFTYAKHVDHQIDTMLEYSDAFFWDIGRTTALVHPTPLYALKPSKNTSQTSSSSETTSTGQPLTAQARSGRLFTLCPGIGKGISVPGDNHDTSKSESAAVVPACESGQPTIVESSRNGRIPFSRDATDGDARGDERSLGSLSDDYCNQVVDEAFGEIINPVYDDDRLSNVEHLV